MSVTDCEPVHSRSTVFRRRRILISMIMVVARSDQRYDHLLHNNHKVRKLKKTFIRNCKNNTKSSQQDKRKELPEFNPPNLLHREPEHKTHRLHTAKR